MVNRTKVFFEFLPGFVFCFVIAVFSFATWFLWKPISCLMWSFIYSIIISNVIHLPGYVRPGINFVSSTLLKGTIAALGLVTSAVIWLQVGIGVVNALIVISFSFFFGLWLGRRVGLSDRLSTLIGVGTSICGASAIAAMAPAIEAKEEEIGLAIAGITLFGLASMFLYPFLFLNTPIYSWFIQNSNVYAIWVGSGIHETAQVIAAASALGQDVIRPAMLIKSVRIFMIGPVVLLASFLFNRFDNETGEKNPGFVIPVFGILFIVNSVLTAIFDAYLTGVALGAWQFFKAAMGGRVIPFLLAIGFAGVGSKVRYKNISQLGVKPFAVAALMAILAGILSLCLAILVAPMIPK